MRRIDTTPPAAASMEASAAARRLARVHLWLLAPGLTAVYFMAGKLGLGLAYLHASASPVWPPTGIALAVVLLFGLRVWPAILVGAFLVNLTTAGNVETSIAIACGNTLEALLGAWLVNRYAGGATAFHRPRTAIRFTFLAAVLATMVSATIGVLSLWLAGLAQTANLQAIWLTWWLGDATGAVVIAPLILLWAVPDRQGRPPGGALEGVGLGAAVILVGWIVFQHKAPNAYIFLGPLVWAALRFGRRGAATTALVLSAMAAWGTLAGYGPFYRPSPNESLLYVQSFVGVMSLAALILAATVRERERAERAVRHAHGELEGKIQERTASLRAAVDELDRSRSALTEAQALAHIGSWEWDVQADRVTWSDELYRIYGLPPQSQEIDYRGFLDRVHRDDRARVDAAVRAALESGEPFDYEHRVVRPDGDVRTVHAQGRVLRDGDRTVGMLGTGQDVTQRREAEQALRESEERFRLLSENSSDIITFTFGRETAYVSPAIRRILGYEPDELLGEISPDLLHPEDRGAVEGRLRTIGRDADVATATFRVRHKDGSYVWVESVASALRSDAGELEGMIGITRDVTATVERARFRELLQAATAAANEAASADAALRAALEVVCRFREWPLGHVYVRAEGGADELAPTAIWYPEKSAGHDEFRRVTEETRFARGVGLPGRVLATGRPAWIPDVTRDGNFPRARLVRDLGLRSAFGFPVRVGSEILAVMEFFTTEIVPPEQPLLDVLQEIGTQVGQVLRRQEAEDTLRHSESMLAQAQAIAHVGSWEWNVEANRVTWSDELYRIHGREPGSLAVTYEEFLGHVHPSDRARIEAAVQGALRAGGSFHYEYRLVRPDGTMRMVATEGQVEVDERGAPASMRGVCQDVTERRQAEEALRESEQRYRFLADYATDLITMLTPDGRCMYASPSVRSLLGYSAEELVGRPVGDLVHRDDADDVSAARQAILTSAESRTVRCRLRRKDEQWIWTETTSRGVRDPATGLVVSVVAVTRDVTESVRSERTTRLLERVSTIANEAITTDAAMKAALEAIGRYAGWPIGHVYIPSRSAGGELTPSDIWYLDDPGRFADFRKLSEMTPFVAGEGLPGAVLATGRAHWVSDIPSDETFIRRPAAVALGLSSAFAFPIRAMGETLAVLEFFSPEAWPLNEATLHLMEAIGDQLGQAVRRQRVESALRTSEVRFRAVAETAKDGIITIDEESRIVYCNAAARSLFGFDDLVGKSVETIIPERFHEHHRAGVDRYHTTGESRILGKTVELMARRADGREIPIELSLADWSTEDGLYFTGIVRDIAPRKEAEMQLNEKMEELARSNAELGLFSYVASHDLREPLRTVASNVQLLEREMGPRLTGPAKKSLRFALDGVYRMQELINDLLAYSRVGTEAQAFQTVDTEIVLDEILAALAATIESEGAEITRGPLPEVWADRTQVGQILQNLVSNALKFHQDAPPRIHITSTRDGDRWMFSVRDEGVGFDPDFADHIFTIFQRLHAPEEFPGTGIGLAICRKIVERHGGRIWAESEKGKGSVFHFTLPAVRDGTPPP